MSRDIETLAVAQAVLKVAGEHTKTGRPDNLRGRVDEHYKRMFEETGAKSFDVRIGDINVGTYSVKVTKPKDDVILKVSDYDEYVKWCESHDCIMHEPDTDKVTALFLETGEVPDGCSTFKVKDSGGEFGGGIFKVDPFAVNDAIKAIGGEPIPALLLEGDA